MLYITWEFEKVSYVAEVDLVSYSFATNQPHTRAPMSNMLPDFMVVGPDFRWPFDKCVHSTVQSTTAQVREHFLSPGPNLP